jgi:hypothetical protein
MSVQVLLEQYNYLRNGNSKGTTLIISVSIWLLFIIFFQYVDPFLTISKCSFDDNIKGLKQLNSKNIKTENVLIISDPQLIDKHTYPNRNQFALSLSKITADNYLYKNYVTLVKTLKPQTIIFLGDLLDNGRESPDSYYEAEFERFTRLFVDSIKDCDISLFTNVPGNHDIGWENGVTEHSLKRFEKHFGNTNKIIRKDRHDLIFFDDQSLTNTENALISQSSRQFLEKLNKEKSKRTRLLFTHVPLWRDPNTQTCGKLRESQKPFPIAKGYQYQTVIDSTNSLHILQSIKPAVIFAGDDHDYCELIHSYADEHAEQLRTLELTIKSMSMAMGIKHPAVELLTLYDEPIELGHDWIVDDDIFKKNGDLIDYSTEICYMTTPYTDIGCYIFLGVFNAIFLLLNCSERKKSPASIFNASLRRSSVKNFLQPINFSQFLKLSMIHSVIVLLLFYLLTYY